MCQIECAKPSVPKLNVTRKIDRDVKLSKPNLRNRNLCTHTSTNKSHKTQAGGPTHRSPPDQPTADRPPAHFPAASPLTLCLLPQCLLRLPSRLARVRPVCAHCRLSCQRPVCSDLGRCVCFSRHTSLAPPRVLARCVLSLCPRAIRWLALPTQAAQEESPGSSPGWHCRLAGVRSCSPIAGDSCSQ
jgi:hypothetical protein